MLARSPAKAAPELELKFQLGAGAVEALRAESFPLEKSAVAQLHAVYFDTPGHALRDAGFSLRVRRKGDTFVQTLKHRAAGGLFERDEWETQVAGQDVDLAALADTPAMAAIGDAALGPAFTVEVERRTHVWTEGRTQVEVSFDTGLIVADGRQEPIAEMELELLAGAPAALFGLARELQAKAAITLSFESKAERGYRLAGHDGIAALKAQRTAVGPKTTGAEAFQQVSRDALVQIAGNARLLQRAHNPDVLHQLRVGLRRLRAGLAVFKGLLDPEGLNGARRETKWLAGELAEARDIDVFLQNAATTDEIEESAGRAAFFRALRIAQAEAYERALAAVGSERFRTLLLTLGEWIDAGAWLRLAHDEQRALREGPATALAAPILDKLDKRVRRRSRKFMHIDVAARHDLRKQAKKLRYAAAFFGERYVTLEEAARDVPFQLWAPARLAGRWGLNVVHRPEMTGPRVPESVLLLLHDGESLHDFGIEEAAERLLSWRTGGARTVTMGEEELRVIGGSERLPGPPLEVHLERGGTHIRLYSGNLDEAALLEVAAALEPAPTERPPLIEP